MTQPQGLFNLNVWKPALDKFGAVTHLTVLLYDAAERVVCGPAPPSPLFAVFEKYGYHPGIFCDCARKCLAQDASRPALVVASSYGLAVVGTSLLLEGAIVGAAVAGYALVDFSQASAIERLARQARIPFHDLWGVARQQQPVPERRLILHGELLQVLGDTILRENHRTRQREDMAARLEKEMAAKDEFLAVVSHELRTPLTAIFGWANLMQRTDRVEDQRKGVAAIERNALLQIKLVDDLLDMSRIIKENIPLDISLCDLSDLLTSALDTVAETAAGKKIEVKFTGVTGPMVLKGDVGRLQQVFVNILSNAVKFTPPGGRIHMTVEREADHAIVKIADTGKGIAKDFLPYVFDMFRQQEEGTQRQYGGLGIGLALVKRLVELHQGRVGITSGGEAMGTEVTVQLPLAKTVESSPAPGVVEEKDDSLPFEHLTILAVEDTEDTLEALHLLLKLLGAQVLTARDGVEALLMLSTEIPDLVLCDLRMPRMDGFEFLRELRRIHGFDHPPVFALSGLTNEAAHRRSQAAGFEGHIDKPFDQAALISTVRPVLDRRRIA